MSDVLQQRKRPGGRTARNRRAVHDAVLGLILEDRGRIQVADIAARSGVHPTTIYRRWGTVEALVLEVAVDRLGAASEVPPTGSLRDDLLAYATRLNEGTHGADGLALLHAVVTASAANRGQDHGFLHVRRRGIEIQAMLDRHPDTSVTLENVFDGILAPIYMRVLFDLGDIAASYLEDLVDRLLSAPRGSRPERNAARSPTKRRRREAQVT